MSDLLSWASAHVPDQSGRTAIVTGANSGIGLETARALAHRGAHVVLACRDLDRARAAEADIAASVPGASLEVSHLDLADLASVRAFARSYEGSHERLDLLINNAGVMAIPRRETADGFEMQFGTNVLGHFALTGRLLPLVLGTRHSRIVWLSSLAHKRGRINFDDLQGERSYTPWGAYMQSKLADLVLALELQRRLAEAGSSTISVAAHPGWTATNLQSRGPEMSGSKVQGVLAMWFNAVLAMDTWRGALPTLVAATASRVRPGDYIGPHGPGEIWGRPGRARISDRARDEDTGRRLWARCETLTGVDAEVGRPRAVAGGAIGG